MPHRFLTWALRPWGTRMAFGLAAAMLSAAPASSTDHPANRDGFVFYRKPAPAAVTEVEGAPAPEPESAQEAEAPDVEAAPETSPVAPTDSLKVLREENARLSALVASLEQGLAQAQEETSRLRAKVQAILAVPQTLDTQMTRLYRVQEGDTLYTIAQKAVVYDDGRLWKRIYEANRQVLADPRQLRPGQELVIPR